MAGDDPTSQHRGRQDAEEALRRVQLRWAPCLELTLNENEKRQVLGRVEGL